MLKTILRTVLVILVLAGVFFFALRMWEGKRGAPPTAGTPPEATPEAAVTVRQVSVVSTAEGALLQIEDVAGPGYTITDLETGNGFVVDIPGAKVGLLQSSIPNPHPMVRNIDASQVFAQGSVHARIRVELAQEATHRDRLQASTLYIDLVSKGAPTATPTPEMTARPTPKPVVKASPRHKTKAAPKKKTTVVRKTVKTRTVAQRPAPAPKSKPAPVNNADSDSLLRDLGIGGAAPAPAPAPEAKSEPVPEALVPAEPAPSAAAPLAPAGDAPVDLDALFDESGGKAPDAAPAPAEAPPPMAALPPPDGGKFDSSQVARDLPALTGISVASEGETTVVRISRESSMPYKVFKMANPNRITVDFKNSASHLKPTYPAFAGTKVKKVTTQQFPGQEGVTRITFFIDSLPKYEASVDGNDLVLKLP